MSFALPPLIAEAFGQSDHKRIAANLANSLYINLAYALVSISVIELLIPHLDKLGQEPQVVENAIPYLRLSMYSMLPFMAFQAFRSMSDSMGDTALSMKALLLGNALNIGLNYLFIFGKLGAPQMGVLGAGLSSLIARSFMVFLWLGFIWKKKEFRDPVGRLAQNQFDSDLIKQLFGLGFITALQMLFEVSLFSGSTLIMGMIGEVPQAAHQIALNLITITFMVTTGFSVAATITVGQHLGSGHLEKIKVSGFTAIGMSATFMAITAIGFLLFRHHLPYLYIQEVEVVDMAASLLVFAALFQISDGVQVSALGALRGLQDVNIPAIFTFIAYLLIGLPLAWVGAFTLNLGPSGVWLGLLAGLSISALLNSFRFNYLQQKLT